MHDSCSRVSRTKVSVFVGSITKPSIEVAVAVTHIQKRKRAIRADADIAGLSQSKSGVASGALPKLQRIAVGDVVVHIPLDDAVHGQRNVRVVSGSGVYDDAAVRRVSFFEPRHPLRVYLSGHRGAWRTRARADVAPGGRLVCLGF